MAVWGSAVERRTDAEALGYADDVYAVADVEAPVHDATRVTKEFVVGFTTKKKVTTKFGLEDDAFFPDVCLGGPRIHWMRVACENHTQ